MSSDYPLLDILWTMFVFFLWVAWFMLLFRVVSDVFRRRDLGGGGKVLWLIFVIAVPFLGVFVYLLGQNNAMAERDANAARTAQLQVDDYVRTVASTGSPAADTERAKGLLGSGAITDEEYAALKSKALA